MKQTILDEWINGKISQKKWVRPGKVIKTKLKDLSFHPVTKTLLEEIKEVLLRVKRYKEVKIPKKSGGHRSIYVPHPELKSLQRKILRFLKIIYNPRFLSVFGLFRYKNNSYVNHAKVHSNSRWIFQCDIKNAFPSVNVRLLKSFLTEELEGNGFYSLSQKLAEVIIEAVTFNGILPQGAPTSPFLFYFYLVKNGLIEELRTIYINYLPKLEVSLYIDGIVCSGKKPIPPEIKKQIFKAVESAGFEINKKKTRLQDCRHGAPLITGVRVNGRGEISLPKKVIRKWRGIINIASHQPGNEELKEKVEGFIASLKPIYGDQLPTQIVKPYARFLENIKNKMPA